MAELKTVKIDKLIPYAKNARTHSDGQIAQIAASIKEFGWTSPILTDGDNGVIAGHGRLLAARKLNMDEVPVIELSGMSKAQKKAYIIADNQLALNAGWDMDFLKIELEELQLDDFNIDLLGFGDDFLNSLVEIEENTNDPDLIPEIPDDPITKPGDVWILGNHRIICGDSTDALVVDKVLNGVKPHLMVTDPPYGVEYDASWRNHAEIKIKGRISKIGARAIGKVLNDDRSDWRESWALFPGNIAYVWHAGLLSPTVAESLEACGFKIRSQIIWAKNNFAIGRADYHWQHEPCLYAVRGTGNWTGDRKQSTVWKIDKPLKSETGHSTQKPVECMRKPMENNSSPGQAVYEPFSGSGTTIIAAEQTGRHCYAIELSPAYVDVAVKRWQDYSGKIAVLESTGETYNSKNI